MKTPLLVCVLTCPLILSCGPAKPVRDLAAEARNEIRQLDESAYRKFANERLAEARDAAKQLRANPSVDLAEKLSSEFSIHVKFSPKAPDSINPDNLLVSFLGFIEHDLQHARDILSLSHRAAAIGDDVESKHLLNSFIEGLDNIESHAIQVEDLLNANWTPLSKQ